MPEPVSDDMDSVQTEEPASPSSGVESEANDSSLSAALADLVGLFVEYVRQETGDLVRDKVVVPTQKAGQVVAFALAAASVLFLGVCFLSVAAVMVLAQFISWPGALGAIGGVLVVGALALTLAKRKRVQ